MRFAAVGNAYAGVTQIGRGQVAVATVGCSGETTCHPSIVVGQIRVGALLVGSFAVSRLDPVLTEEQTPGLSAA